MDDELRRCFAAVPLRSGPPWTVWRIEGGRADIVGPTPGALAIARDLRVEVAELIVAAVNNVPSLLAHRAG